jgi:hypothetical protein
VSCRDKCRELGFEDAIEYGITRKYVETRRWGLWEVFREIIQNALDEMQETENQIPTVYPCRSLSEPEGVAIYDYGRGLGIRHLLIGTSEKKPWQRGKFGEGLKLALLAATHLGIPITILSGDKVIQPTFVTKVIEGVPIDLFCVCYKSAPPITGTRVIIQYPDLCSQFKFRVVQGIREYERGREIDCILYSFSIETELIRSWYAVINKHCSEGTSSIYVRDLYVSTFKEVSGLDACFSYNLYDVEIDESRRIPAGGSVMNEVRHVWNEISYRAIEDPKAYNLLKKLLKCAVEGCKQKYRSYVPFETDIDAFMTVYYDRSKKVIAKAFNELYGEDVVIIHDPELLSIADYLGIEHIYCPYTLGISLEDITNAVSRIKKHLEKLKGNVVPKEKMPPELRERLELVEEIINTIFAPEISARKVKLEYAILPTEPGNEVHGKYDPLTKTIYLNYNILLRRCMGKGVQEAYRCLAYCISTFIHELGHDISNAGDLTKELQKAITELAGESTIRAMIHSEYLQHILREFYKKFSTG